MTNQQDRAARKKAVSGVLGTAALVLAAFALARGFGTADIAQINALARAEAAPAGHQAVHLRLGRVHLDAAGRRATAGDTALPLRDKELRLLEVLLRHAGEVVSRTRLAERVWGSAFDVTDNAIDVTASGLRLKLADADPGVTIETVRGVGYRIVGA